MPLQVEPLRPNLRTIRDLPTDVCMHCSTLILTTFLLLVCMSRDSIETWRSLK
ncbi:Protein of unknown function [Pyronema omphalodes CBS 100304]|uniref:Uncharacterized protein n=1 Tax=Pyronema omphalodes (strain CBS 100304) TaxID=1076935 RepID=U4LCV6_PYROM|nr:Protein of unknown function [Pyronema omphalodes CBS 100304]